MKKIVNGVLVDTNDLEEVVTWEETRPVDLNGKFQSRFSAWNPTFTFRLYRNPVDHEKFVVTVSNGFGSSSDCAVAFVGKGEAMEMYQEHESPYSSAEVFERWFGPFPKFVEAPVTEEEAAQC